MGGKGVEMGIAAQIRLYEYSCAYLSRMENIFGLRVQNNIPDMYWSHYTALLGGREAHSGLLRMVPRNWAGICIFH